MEVFLKLAHANTSKNIETCGVLAGHLSQNQLNITHIITPQQQGTPDSCNTMHEEQIFDVQDQMQLITLGWIHVGVLYVVVITFLTIKCSLFADPSHSDCVFVLC